MNKVGHPDHCGCSYCGDPDGTKAEMARMLDAEVAAREGRERIVAAAIQVPVDPVWANKDLGGYPEFLTISAPPPARHHSLLHPFIDAYGARVCVQHQGFITSTGRYVGREEGLQLAIAAGQVDPNNRKSGSASTHLFSEDLW